MLFRSPLKTTLERLQSKGKNVSIFSYLASPVLMIVFAYNVANTYNSVIMSVSIDSVSPHNVNRCVGCGEKINNKVL